MSESYASTYYSMEFPPRLQEWVSSQQQEGVGGGTRKLKLKSREHFHFMTSLLTGCTIDEATADVMFVCKHGAVVKAHRIALCLTSEYFTNILNDQKPGEMTVINIPEIPADILSMILSLIYKSTQLVKPGEKFVQLMEWLQVFRLSKAIAVEPDDIAQATPPRNEPSQNINLENASAASNNIPTAPAPVPIPTDSAAVDSAPTPTPGPSTNSNISQVPTVSATTGREHVFKRPFLPGTNSEPQAPKKAKLTTRILEPQRANPKADRAHSLGLPTTTSGQQQQEEQPNPNPRPTSGTNRTSRTRSLERGRSRFRLGAVNRSSSAGSISIPGDYAGKRFRKLLGSNPKSARLQQKLGQMRWKGLTRNGRTGKTIGHVNLD